MPVDLSGRVVVVTGGTQGVGEAVARYAAGCGAAGLVICGRNEERGRAVADDLSGQGCPTEFVRAELADPDDCRAVVTAADRRFGRIHGLVNAAGLTDRGHLHDTSVELWDRIYAVNVRAPFLLMQGCTEVMRRESIAGSVVNIITMSSHGGQPFLTAYASSKGALAVLTKNVAHALRFDRIRVNGINIGWTDTPNEHKVQREAMGRSADWLAESEAQQPFGRLVKPIDVARLTGFLLSEESGIMTGAVIDHDQMVMGAYG